MAAMQGITIKLPKPMLERLRDEAASTGRSVAELVRERLESAATPAGASVHDLTADLAGRLDGSGRSATNERRRFKKS